MAGLLVFAVMPLAANQVAHLERNESSLLPAVAFQHTMEGHARPMHIVADSNYAVRSHLLVALVAVKHLN